MDNKSSNNSLNYLNVFKFIGILVISIIYHSLINITNENLHVYTFLKTYGRIFVEMLFIISGMLFYHVYFSRLRQGGYAKKLIIKKIIAFYPLIIFVNLYGFLLSLFVYKAQGKIVYDLNVLNLVLCLLFGDLSAIKGPTIVSSLWYLNVLLLVTLISIILVLLQKKKERKWIYLIPLIVGVVMYVLFRTGYSFVFWRSYIPRGLIAFNVGIYLMIYFKRFEKYSFEKKMYIRIIAAGLLFVSIAVLFSNVILSQLTKKDYDITLYFTLTVFPSLFTLCHDVKWLNKICGFKVVNYICSLSIGLYAFRGITHQTIIAIVPMYKWCKSIGGWSILLDLCIQILISILLVFLYKKLKVYLENKFVNNENINSIDLQQ